MVDDQVGMNVKFKGIYRYLLGRWFLLPNVWFSETIKLGKSFSFGTVNMSEHIISGILVISY